MNLSKTEKLLAARKKLKEFQLNKKGQSQENVAKQENDLAKEAVQKLEQTDIMKEKDEKQSNISTNSFEKEFLRPIQNVDTTASASTDIPEDNEHFKTENSIFNTTLDASSAPAGETVHNSNENLYDRVSEVSNTVDKENNTIGEGISSAALDDNRKSHPLPHVTLDGNNTTDYLRNTSPREPSTVQKQHLLQMASAVADALTDGNEYCESTTLTDDLQCRNQFLTSCLEEQKQTINQLHIQVSQYSTRLSELETILATKDAEFEAKLVRELSPLKEQLQIHAQTTGILIGEKAELTAALSQSQLTAKQKCEENEELSAKLKNSQFRINELEKELIAIKNDKEDVKKLTQKLQTDYDNLNQKYTECRKDKEDLELEFSELKQKLNLKNTEMVNLQQELLEKSALLSMNELRIQQLTNSSQEIQSLEVQQQSVAVLEQQLVQMRETLQSLNTEKEEASKQYQSYIRQLDMQNTKLQSELENGRKTISDLENRERNYIKQLSELEQLFQREKAKLDALTPLKDQKEYIENLTKNIDELTLQQERLHIALSEKDTDIEALKKEVQDLRDLNEQNVEAAKLAKALESEQLGASRAVSQNQQLKQQLNEMHDAFVLLSNTKLDLTEQLQAERTIGRKLNIQLNKVESDMERLKEELKEKETSLIELEKQKLHNAQIADQMQHYQAQSHHAHTLQQELQNALVYIENLKKENDQLKEQLNEQIQKGAVVTDDSKDSSTEQTETLYQEQKDRADINDEIKQSVVRQTIALQTEEVACSNYSESMKKLEERFKETIEKVAELTDEKQRLEHLVLQLQSETETIGEYITLYQKQRAILQEKAKEKEQSFRQIVEQRNLQQEQLHKLKLLVADLIKRNPDNVTDTTSASSNHKDAAANEPTESERQEHKDINTDTKGETTSQILELLTEIKDCKDICILEPNFHPCPWCYGKLITV